MTDAAAPAAHTDGARTIALRWPTILVLAVFAVLYAWDLWEAIENLVVLPGESRSVGRPVPWTALIAGLILPPAVFTLAAVLGRRRRTLELAGLLAAGLCLVAVLSLGLTAYVRAGGL